MIESSSVISRNAFVAVICILLAAPSFGAAREEARVAEASEVLDELLRIPERSIPPALLSSAYAIAVIPNVVKVGFGIGARRGRGIIVVRRDDGSWSNPAFVTMTGGSIGWQVGAQATDVILVFRSPKGVERIAEGKFTLGADASVAAGPVGRHTAVATDLRFEAEVVSYSRSRGLFAGVALEGAGITMDRKSNASFYDSSGMTPEKIFASAPGGAPDVAGDFLQILSGRTARLPSLPRMQAETAPPSAEIDEPANVRTFGVPDPAEQEFDSTY